MKNPLVKLPNLWQLTAVDVRRHFDLNVNATLPNEYHSRAYYGPRGRVMLHIFPKDDVNVNQHNNRAHRIFATCPGCAKFIPFSRMQQHVKRKDHENITTGSAMQVVHAVSK